MKLLTSLFRLEIIAVLAVTALLSLPFGRATKSTTAEACWNHLRIECFDSTRMAWPWCLPTGTGRCWRVNPPVNQPTWGIQNRIYSVRIQTLCGNDDDQALWVIGGPGTFDPDFDNYPAGRSIYTTYGPLNLTNVQYGRVQFSMYFLNNMDLGDTICWGADSVSALATTHIWVDTVLNNPTQGWHTFTMDLADLYRNVATRDSVSAIGRPAVYVYWWFRSDNDQIADKGGFLDDVIISVDEGTVDMIAGGLEIRGADGNTVPTRIETGDSIRARVSWATCPGAIAVYPEFIARLYMDGELVYDSVMTNTPQDTIYTWLTAPIEMTTAGPHEFNFQVDPQFAVNESNENNNTLNTTFTVETPNAHPTFQWIAPGADTLHSTDGSVVLSWLLSDPDDEATCIIHIDTDTMGCIGPIVPRANNRGETEIPDTVHWSTVGITPGSVRWPFAEYSDPHFYACSYAPFPVVIDFLDTGEPVLIPVTFSMSQNYPNPFNPETQIDFSITKGGPTKLRVFDINGREVALLIDNELSPGPYQANFNAGINRPSGVYFYRLDAPEGSITKKMILLK
ncbi:MAG: T9SS type A sorting domain-containing protein [Calditrichaeota bacterium]|nr:T9SS type A sorting domain-containing protein [Calditrichota bacterium]MCB9369457.1 T9SS type A sorting domain-containing protein [Calditrichota bacterium]